MCKLNNLLLFCKRTWDQWWFTDEWSVLRALLRFNHKFQTDIKMYYIIIHKCSCLTFNNSFALLVKYFRSLSTARLFCSLRYVDFSSGASLCLLHKFYNIKKYLMHQMYVKPNSYLPPKEHA